MFKTTKNAIFGLKKIDRIFGLKLYFFPRFRSLCAVPNATVVNSTTKRKSPPKSSDFKGIKKRRVLEPWTPENLAVEGKLPSGMAEYCIQFLVKNNKLPAITFMHTRGVRVRIVKNDTSRMFLKYVGPNFDSAVYFYRDKAYKVK